MRKMTNPRGQQLDENALRPLLKQLNQLLQLAVAGEKDAQEPEDGEQEQSAASSHHQDEAAPPSVVMTSGTEANTSNTSEANINNIPEINCDEDKTRNEQNLVALILESAGMLLSAARGLGSTDCWITLPHTVELTSMLNSGAHGVPKRGQLCEPQYSNKEMHFRFIVR